YDGVIAKCAALAAQEHGDARRAIDLLRVAGELAERNGDTQVDESHVSQAEDKVDSDRILDAIKTQPKQTKAVIYSVFLKLKENERLVLTGEVYDEYKTACKKLSLKILTQRRFSDILSEIDLLGIINARIISKGRYGRMREITSSVSDDLRKKVILCLKEEFYF
ncbi:MAG: cell division control protein Cdc6, partial [Candidatus Aenigmarchaeota archaeon]|nr:cell division control protein Cdc6 [Candidatus Aenigmarchaeota archaeon]